MKPLKNVTKKMIMAVKYFVGEAKFNKTKALMMAGFSHCFADKNGAAYFKDPLVSKLLEAEMTELANGAKLSAEYLIFNMMKVIDSGMKPKKMKKTITRKDGSVEVLEWEEEKDPRASIEASRLLSQCLSEFRQKVEQFDGGKIEGEDEGIEFSDGTCIEFKVAKEDKVNEA